MPTHLRYQHLVPSNHAHRNPVPLLVHHTGTNSQHIRLVQLLDSGLGEENSTSSLRVGLYSLYENTVEEGRKRADGLEGGCLGKEVGALALAESEEDFGAHHCG